jgi:very-short-patch-repair endonuclease
MRVQPVDVPEGGAITRWVRPHYRPQPIDLLEAKASSMGFGAHPGSATGARIPHEPTRDPDPRAVGSRAVRRSASEARRWTTNRGAANRRTVKRHPMSATDPVLDQAELEARLHELASGQHGVVTRGQLIEAGVASSWIDRRVRSHRLRPLHRGVYQVGPVRGPHWREMAAVLASGSSAVLCRRSAAGMQELLPPQPRDQPVQVYVGESPRLRPGIRTYRTTSLGSDEVTELQGIPITTPARTLLDLAADSPLRELRRALAWARRRKAVDPSELLQMLRRHPRRRGVGHLRRLIEAGAEADFTRSEAEERLLELVRKADLPRPLVNVRLKGFEVDLLWRRHRLVVEVDGFDFHSSRSAFEGDRRRDARLGAAGYQVLRVTWRHLEQEPEAVLVRLAQALARSSAR